jgi:DNA-binding NtrC family response regulator
MRNPASPTLRLDAPATRSCTASTGVQPTTAPGDASECLPGQVCAPTRALLESAQDLGTFLAEAPSVLAPGGEIVTRSARMLTLLEQAQRVAASKVSVLLEGESGTGKELVARLIHRCSPRVRKPFVCVNCAALSESLVESELFGHEKGAFTGAAESRAGRFEWAHGGTLLLDEISEISVKLQAKLLRVLEAEEFERVGGAETVRVDVRVLATTNRNLEQEIAGGNFRQDLFYRLNTVQFRLLPLRSRREDIPILVAHFVERFRHEAGDRVDTVAARTLELLTAYDWPGNVRQLRNVIQRACLLAAGPEIQPEDLPPLEPVLAGSEALPTTTLSEMERRVILSTLREFGGNKTAVAKRLGVTTRTLLNKLNRYRQQGMVS